MAREMKDSGIEWIGEIPAEWNIARIGAQYTERKTKVSDAKYPPLSVTMKGIVPQLATAAKTDAHDDRKLVRKGDFAINSRSDRRGSCGISAYDGSVSLINTILIPRDEMNPKYYDWLFHCTMFSDEFYKWGHGIVDDLWTTNWQDMKKIVIPEPSLQEQQRIADFLDTKCSEIDAVIEKTKATIEEYKKLKQSVITEAVTKGIRGNRPMKDSGIEWIGEIPVEWSISRIKYVSSFEPSIDKPDLDEESIITYTPMDCIKNGYFINNTAPLGSVLSSLTAYQDGDIVMAKVTPCFENGNIAIMENLASGFGLGSSELFVFRPISIEKKYLFYWLRNNKFIQSACSTMTGTGGLKRVSPYFVKNCYLHFPPFLEQQEIVEYLDKKCAEIDALIAKKTALLEELEAYKRSVIYEYVTGKKECVSAEQAELVSVVYPYFPATLNTDKLRFAQAILMSRILDKCRKKMGRVKLEKMLYTIETSIGFNFDTEYVREAAGPLDDSIYDCEAIISRKNKWYTKKESKYGVSYTPTKDSGKYKKYYDRYFAGYDSEIERIIGIFMDYDADQAEIVATLFAAWNDFIIDQRQFTDDELVDEVLNNWNDRKKRFPRDVWQRAIEQMRKNNIIPKGYGKHTVKKLK